MPYRDEPVVESERRGNEKNDIRTTTSELVGLIGETYSATAAVYRFLFGDEPVRESMPDKSDCLAAELALIRERAREAMELAVTMAKRLGA